MSLGSMARAVATFVILVLLHYTLRPLLGWRAPMDFLVLALLLASSPGRAPKSRLELGPLELERLSQRH